MKIHGWWEPKSVQSDLLAVELPKGWKWENDQPNPAQYRDLLYSRLVSLAQQQSDLDESPANAASLLLASDKLDSLLSQINWKKEQHQSPPESLSEVENLDDFQSNL